MGTNAITWFYTTPEKGRPYLISERVNQTFWANRMTGIYFSCVNAEAPYRLVGTWQGIEVELEYEVGSLFILRMSDETAKFIKGVSEILGFPPTVSYTDLDGRYITEWYAKDSAKRLQEVQGNPTFQNIKIYKR
jgi:hypothetical protein